jgi:hypothetical protein
VITTLGNNRKEMLIWDIGKEAPAIKVESESLVHSFSWKSDGALVATTGKDIVQVWDPRAEKAAIQVREKSSSYHFNPIQSSKVRFFTDR